MKLKSVVLLSAGLDSTVNFYQALRETDIQLALTFNYGQKAALKEIEKAQKISEINKISHLVIDLPWLKSLGTSSLTNQTLDIPINEQISIDDLKKSNDSAKAVWVPNRNGVFLNVAASFAESLKADIIVPGFNAEEAITFPDNSDEFIHATNKSLFYSTANHIKVICYTIKMSKIEIVQTGRKIAVPFELTWPCYFDQHKWCGQCESCLRAKRAFKNVDDKLLTHFEN